MSENAPADRRVRRTRAALHNALFALMLEKDYDAITVQDIADRADVVRSTFYMHFTDKDEMLRIAVAHVRDWAVANAPPGVRFGFSEPLFRHASEVGPVLRTVAQRQTWGLVHRLFSEIIGELVRKELLPARQRAGTVAPDAVAVDAVAHLVSAAWTSVLTWSLERDRASDAAEMDRLFRAFALPGADAVLSAQPA